MPTKSKYFTGHAVSYFIVKPGKLAAPKARPTTSPTGPRAHESVYQTSHLASRNGQVVIESTKRASFISMLNRSKVISIRTRSAVFRGDKKTETLVRYHITHPPPFFPFPSPSRQQRQTVRPVHTPSDAKSPYYLVVVCGIPALMPLKRLCFLPPPLFLSVFSMSSSGWDASPLVEQKSF